MIKFKGSIIFLVAAGFLLMPLLADEIHDAAKAGNLNKVKILVTKDPSLVSAKTSRGTTPLHYACISKNVRLVKFLVSKGADVNALNASWYSPLHYAAAENRPEAVKSLIANGADMEVKTREGETPLHMTAYDGAVEAAELLIEKGADLNVKNAYGRTPFLLVARESGSVTMAKLLLNRGSNIDAVDESNASALELSAWRGFKDFVNMLLNRGAAIPDRPKAKLSLLSHSLKRRLEMLLQALIKSGLNLKETKKSRPQLILVAASGGSTRILNLLAKEGFDLRYIDTNGWTPLHCAAQFDRIEAVKFLLSKGVDMNARTLMGETAYNITQSENCKKAAEFLKKKGADTGLPRFPELKGKYLGQKRPGNKPVPFAPGIVRAHFGLHTSVVFSPDGKTAFWVIMIPPRESGYGSGRMLGTTIKNGKWTYPVLPSFIGGDVPFFAPDGKRLYFISRKPLSKGGSRKENIWFVERNKTGWSVPRPVDPVVNSVSMHWQFSIDKKGTFYIGSGDGRILVSHTKDSKYQNPQDFKELYKNDSVKGGGPFISPDGDYLIFGKNDDLHITFKKADGSWTQALNLGKDINSPSYDMCPIVSPDGEYLFYLTSKSGQNGPHWVAIKDTLKKLRRKALGKYNHSASTPIEKSRKSAAKELQKLLKTNPQKAKQVFKKYILKDKAYHYSEKELDNLGYSLIKQNKIKEAVTVFQINVEVVPGSWKGWDSLGEGYMYLNDEARCRQAYNKSLKINPENRNAAKMLRYLDEFLYGIACETKISPKFSPGESTGINKPYFGQVPPGDTPKLFAPGIVSTRGNLEYSCTFSPDGREMFFTARIGKNIARMFYGRWGKDGWTFPKIPKFSEGHIDYLPYIMPNGKKTFFGRIEKDDNGAVISNGLYLMNKIKSKSFPWSEPFLYKEGNGWMHVSATEELTIYTTYLPTRKTARFRFINGGYPKRETPEGGLHPSGHPSIAPDESYIIFDSEREGGFGNGDLWVSFRNPDGTWGEAINLGQKINTPGNESIPHLTPDGKYLFYTSNRDIYWVSTKFIHRLQESARGK